MTNTYTEWKTYRNQELARIHPIVEALGFSLEEQQPHIDGERFLMQAVTTESGKKLILLGRRIDDGLRVVIKATRDKGGMKELLHERESRKTLHTINFAYQVFFSPKEIYFGTHGDFMLAIHEFIEQESPFLKRPNKQQFSFALSAFKAQEGAHATTSRHIRRIQRVFDTKDAVGYVALFSSFLQHVTANLPEETALHKKLSDGLDLLQENTRTIEQYTGFLTHTDFVPHNFRIRDNAIYLLDHSSLRFGNKHEGWARFINFMTLHNPELVEALCGYIRENRASEEALSLKLMRIYRLGEIIRYYTGTLAYTSENLRALNAIRVHFWSDVLGTVLSDTPLPEHVRTNYIQTRDSLRSKEEKLRQIDLH